MKKFILLLLLVVAPTLFAQNAKKEILLDENNVTLSQEEFNSKIGPPDYSFVYSKIENDTSIINKLIRRKELGIISEENRFKIISALEEITTKKKLTLTKP